MLCLIHCYAHDLNFNLESNCRNKVNPRNYEKRLKNLYFFYRTRLPLSMYLESLNAFPLRLKCTSIKIFIVNNGICQKKQYLRLLNFF